jgi:hypothetical protein
MNSIEIEEQIVAHSCIYLRQLNPDFMVDIFRRICFSSPLEASSKSGVPNVFGSADHLLRVFSLADHSSIKMLKEC